MWLVPGFTPWTYSLFNYPILSYFYAVFLRNFFHVCILLYWQLMPTFSVRAYRQMPTLSVRAYHQIPVLSVRAYHLNPLRPHLLSVVLSPTQIYACHPIFPWAIFRGCSVLVTVVYRLPPTIHHHQPSDWSRVAGAPEKKVSRERHP